MTQTVTMKPVVKNQTLYFPHQKGFFKSPYETTKDMDEAKLMSEEAANLMVKYYASQDIVARKVKMYLPKESVILRDLRGIARA